MKEIYLDNAATTRPWPEVVDAVHRVMEEGFGNASSLHRRGLAAAKEVERAEASIKSLFGNGSWKVFFTSGGTEADTLAVLGSCPRGKLDAAVTSSVEHAAVEESFRRIESLGGRCSYIFAGRGGVVSPLDMAAAVDETTALLSLTYVAGETGAVQPVSEVARLVKRKSSRCRVHVDAVQALPQLERLDLPEAVDMVSVSAHKIHGPQGIGALLCRPSVRPSPILFGGDQQDGLRPGTLNLPGIVGFGVASRLLEERRGRGAPAMKERCDRLVRGILTHVASARALGDSEKRAPGITTIAVAGVESEVLLHALEMRRVLVSSGTACHSRRKKPSRSLVEAGLLPDEGAVRLSLTLDTSDAEIDEAIIRFKDAVESVRGGRAGAP